MNQTTHKPVAMVICQHTEAIDIDIEGPFTPAQCGCILLMDLARAKGWRCPKCNQSDKEMWRPSSIEALREVVPRPTPLIEPIKEGSPWLEL